MVGTAVHSHVLNPEPDKKLLLLDNSDNFLLNFQGQSWRRNFYHGCRFLYATLSHIYINTRTISTKTALSGLVVRVPGHISRGPGRFLPLPDFLRSSGSGTASTRPREYNWGTAWRKSSGSGLEIRNTAVGIRHATCVTPSICKSWHKLRQQAAVTRSL
jgi:hypothetical protein